jgi:hypothetical protein
MTLAELLDPRFHIWVGPVFEQPSRQWRVFVADRQRFVIIGAAAREQLESVRHLVINFEGIAVWIGKVKATLIDVIGGAQDPDAILDQMDISFAQCPIAADLEGDVSQPDLVALWPLRCLRLRMLANVEGVEILAQGHKNPAMFGVFLGNHKTENVTVKPLRSLLICNPQIDVANTLQFNHAAPPDWV